MPGLEREKRKSPEAAFQSKNAILGFVFGVSKFNSSVAGLSLQLSLSLKDELVISNE